ncbi:MAG TPA: hypothetical protein DF613_16050 [Lachnospiraceae bacterium]|nr:hypothetical protein [Lachnospiraceae bacterium]
MKTKRNMFKKFLVTCTALVLALTMALPVSAAGWSFSYSGTSTAPGKSAAKLVGKVKKKETRRKKSCIAKGEDVTYKVGDITIETYSNKKGGTEYLNCVTITGGSTKIAGVKVGDTLSKVQKIKTFKKAKANGMAQSFTKGSTKVQITISKSTKKVTKIRLTKK